jgi:uncharacterized protein (DUF2141 family)
MSLPPIKTLAAILSIATLSQALAAPPSIAQPAAVSGAANLTVTFTGLKSTNGALMVALYDSEAAYSGGQPVQAVRIAANGAATQTVFAGLKPGRYAIKAFHDLNSDGKLNTNPFGAPTEPFAFSNNAQANMGPPSWSDAAFTVAAGANAQTIVIE